VSLRLIHSIGLAALASLAACSGSVVVDQAATEAAGAGAEASSSSSGSANGSGGSSGSSGAASSSSGCFEGGPAAETPSLVFPGWALAVAVSGDRILVAAPVDGGVLSLASDGSDLQVLAPVELPEGLAVDSTHVYWNEILDGGSNLLEAIGRAPLAGGPIEHLFGGADGDLLTNIATDGKGVYFTAALGSENGLYALPVQGGTPEPLADASLGHVATDGQSVFFDYFTAVQRVDVAGTNATVLYDSGGDIWVEEVGGVAVDETDVYFTIGKGRVCCDEVPGPCPCESSACCTIDPEGGRLMRVPKDGGAAVTLLSCLRLPTALALDGTFVYAVDTGGYDDAGNLLADEGRVLAVPKQGGAVKVLADHQTLGSSFAAQLLSGAGDLAVLGTHVYFIVGPELAGGVMRVTH